MQQQQQNKKSNIKTLARSGFEPGTSRSQSGCITTAPPSQLKVTIVVKLFKCFDAMGRNVNKQSRICRPHIFNKFIFSLICLHAQVTIFGSFSYLREYVLLLKPWPTRYRHSIFKFIKKNVFRKSFSVFYMYIHINNYVITIDHNLYILIFLWCAQRTMVLGLLESRVIRT